MQIDHPDAIGEKLNNIERIAHFLLGLADLLELAIAKLREFPKYLIADIAPHYPAARSDMP